VANEVRYSEKAANITRLAGLLATKPDATVTELAADMAVSRATIRNYKNQLNGNGK